MYAFCIRYLQVVGFILHPMRASTAGMTASGSTKDIKTATLYCSRLCSCGRMHHTAEGLQPVGAREAWQHLSSPSPVPLLV